MLDNRVETVNFSGDSLLDLAGDVRKICNVAAFLQETRFVFALRRIAVRPYEYDAPVTIESASQTCAQKYGLSGGPRKGVFKGDVHNSAGLWILCVWGCGRRVIFFGGPRGGVAQCFAPVPEVPCSNLRKARCICLILNGSVGKSRNRPRCFLRCKGPRRREPATHRVRHFASPFLSST